MKFHRNIVLAVSLVFIITANSNTQVKYDKESNPVLLDCYKIWDQAPHNAFTDLIRFKHCWFCTFREGERHVYGEDGKIRIIVSKNGRKWEPAALIDDPGIDLRDPKLSETPDGRLMLVAGGSVYKERQFVTRRPRVAFSDDGKTWTPWYPVLEPGDWLWRVTWFNGKAYGTSYNNSEPDWKLNLYQSNDGINWELITGLNLDGQPNETTLRFLPDGEMIALVRREGGSKNAMIGSSKPPYKDWDWHETGFRIGGPDFIVKNYNDLWAAGRYYAEQNKTVLARFGRNRYQPVLELPSGGDTSYPGLVWFRKKLWISYYSSHEGKTSIYLAKIRLK